MAFEAPCSSPCFPRWAHARSRSVLLLEKKLASSSNGSSSLSGNETAFLTAGSVSSCGCGVTNVLMVTTTVRMLDGVHRNTSHSWPVSLLGVRSVVGGVGAEHRLVSSLTTGANTNHGSAASKDRLANTRWESDAGLLAVFGVTDDNSGSA